MKRHLPSIGLLVVTALCASVASVGLAISTPVTLNVDGQRIASDVAPVTTPTVAFLPIRAIAEATGGLTTFDAATRTVIVRRGANVLRLRLGETYAVLDGHHIPLAHPAFSVRGRAMVPSGVIADVLGSSIRYDARTASIDVRTAGVVVAPVLDDSP